ncbi:MAG: hypothetical protein ACTSPQ_21905 [Candidatus Helarchaeota archaeon]
MAKPNGLCPFMLDFEGGPWHTLCIVYMGKTGGDMLFCTEPDKYLECEYYQEYKSLAKALRKRERKFNKKIKKLKKV